MSMEQRYMSKGVAGELHQEEVAVNTDENSNEVVSADNMCRVCASSLDGDSRKIQKTSKNLPEAFSKLYDLDEAEEAFMPTYLHRRCYQQVD